MSLLSIGKTGLLAAQVGLSTTGNNIANAGVASYSRQTVVQSDAYTQFFGYGYLGTGTQVTAVRRSYDDFLGNQLRNAQATQASLDMYTSQISQVDNLLADTTSGLSPALKDFFSGVQDANSNPASTASRQALLSSANSLVSRFQALDARLHEIGDGVNGQITATVSQINSYSKQIAEINGQISAGGTDPDKLPNDLLDHRDALLTELNKLVKINVVPGANNALSVSFGNGQPLVLNTTPYPLAVSTSPTDVTRVQVGYQSGNNFTPLPDRFVNGGQLGGLLDFRSNALDKAENALGQIAAGLSTSFNAQHLLGQDLNGSPGTAMFAPIQAYVGSNINNSMASTATITAVVSDAKDICTS
ncbi:MAG: flagellar hook-associated protein FlgK [Sphingomonadaceae bacterium]